MADKNKKKVILYALSTCVWCRKTKNLLSQLKIDYQCFDVDLLKSEEKEKVISEMKKYNPQLSFPTLVIDEDLVIIGYDEEKIKKELT
ncbi:MAG: glutaredoxin family protein [candidate division WOR-3 bacterium]|uniref:Glutaredoxin family protein n=1 Tax=candidate division WOR-3 bacterium TaxID=2052148 RepID=A0A7C4S184_UNCW3